jgi:hypothetical protein
MMRVADRASKMPAVWTSAAAVLILAVQCAVSQQSQRTPVKAPSYGTMGFDNTRFFSPRAGEDWVRISALGRRSFISGH